MAKQFQHGTSRSGSIKRQRLLPFLFATTMPYQLIVSLKIQSAPKCPTRGCRSATGKSSPCGIVRKALEKFASIRCADCLPTPIHVFASYCQHGNIPARFVSWTVVFLDLQVKLPFAFRFGRFEARCFVVFENGVDDFLRLINDFDQVHVFRMNDFFFHQRGFEPFDHAAPEF